MLQTVDESAAFNCNDDTTAAVDTPGNLNGTGTADDSTGERIKSKGQYFSYHRVHCVILFIAVVVVTNRYYVSH